MTNEELALILDLSQVDYLDSAGIQLLYQLRERLRVRSQVLRLVIPAGSPANHALKLAGISRYIDISETVEDATPRGPKRPRQYERSVRISRSQR